MAQGSDGAGDTSGTPPEPGATAASGIDGRTGDRSVQAVDVRPREATFGIYLMMITGGISLASALYWMFWGSSLLGGLLFLVLGVAYLFGGRALRHGESWGWGAGVFSGVFVVPLGLFLLPYSAVLIVLAILVDVLLFRVREYYGMVRYDREGEERAKKELATERTSNPEGLHCPRCGSTRLWVAPDHSAFCQNCRAGTISLNPPS